MEPIVAIVAILAAGVAGVAVGFFARGTLSNQSIKAAQDKAARIVAEARAQQKDLILEAKDEKLRLQREAEEEARAKRGGAPEPRAAAPGPRRAARPARRHARGGEPQDPRSRARDRAASARSSARLNQEQVAALEVVSGLSAEDAKGILLEAVREEAEHDAVKLARSIERRARDEADDKAREIIVTAMQRVAADHTAEHTVTVVHLPSDEMKGRIIGREGRNIRALEQATGVDLIIDDTPETVVLSGFDPVRREIARLALTKLIADGRIHPGRIEEVVEQGPGRGRPRDPPGRRAGRLRRRRPGPAGRPHQAPRPAQVPHQLRPERARPLRRDVPPRRDHRRGARRRRPGRQARRPAARHRQGHRPRDGGAARRHRRAVAQKHNLSFKVVNAIAAHHQEVEYACIEAPIVQIADAITASRPGARGESMDTYVKRLEDLQAIAESFTGVERCFAVQAGREVRILVRPEEIDDLTATRLARDIVKKIEDR